MFGKRPDGKRVKKQNSIERMIPLFMPKRSGATNFYLFKTKCSEIDDFIALKKQEGINYNYRDIVLASVIRVFATRPKFNRFFVKDRLYQRKHIDVAMMAHKSLRHGEEEVIIKARFTGRETLHEIKQKMDTAINDALTKPHQVSKKVSRRPQFMVRWTIRLFKFLDRRGILSDKFIFKNSPFHSSIFFADLKSIHLNYVFHHLYDFGNCGFFATMAKERIDAVIDEKTNEVRAEKVLQLGISLDERVADGLYFRHMVKYMERIPSNLSSLELPLTDDQIFVPHDLR